MAIEANVDIEFGQGGSELEKQKLEIHWWYILALRMRHRKGFGVGQVTGRAERRKRWKERSK